jgi:hypothetical protein
MLSVILTRDFPKATSSDHLVLQLSTYHTTANVAYEASNHSLWLPRKYSGIHKSRYSAYWDEYLYSHSGLFLLTKTLLEFFGVLSVRHNRYLIRGASKPCEKSWNSFDRSGQVAENDSSVEL